ncbi:hypothetical protein PRZ48_005133 [Zasmidium cellare]|uniref:Uncharacterized protein n=1 Tax=Zasmidium cellare TaxID=395010 RepID=A0ABR0ERV6_ZASCE|nr:hypothetical protein PRZ48_005133 [Zasmidium cellare]
MATPNELSLAELRGCLEGEIEEQQVDTPNKGESGAEAITLAGNNDESNNTEFFEYEYKVKKASSKWDEQQAETPDKGDISNEAAMFADDEESNQHEFELEFEEASSSDDWDEDAFDEGGGQGSRLFRKGADRGSFVKVRDDPPIRLVDSEDDLWDSEEEESHKKRNQRRLWWRFSQWMRWPEWARQKHRESDNEYQGEENQGDEGEDSSEDEGIKSGPMRFKTPKQSPSMKKSKRTHTKTGKTQMKTSSKMTKVQITESNSLNVTSAR